MSLPVEIVGDRLPILLAGEPPQPSGSAPAEEYLTIDHRQWRALKGNVGRFWSWHGEKFQAFWAGLSAQNKKNMLKVYPENMELAMPARRADALLSSDDAVRVCPELNVLELSSTGGGSLTSLYEKWGRSAAETDLAETRALVRTWLESGRVKGQQPTVFFMLADLPMFPAGRAFMCNGKDAVANVRTVEERGLGIRKDVVDLANFRLQRIFSALALYAHAYRYRILKRESVLVASPLHGCTQCARVDSEEGEELHGCRGCVEKTSVMFCGKGCQRAFFASHVSNCVRLKNDAAGGAAHGCQVCGADKSEDGRKLKTCSGCNNECAKYCSRECQKVAWQAGHKRECKVS